MGVKRYITVLLLSLSILAVGFLHFVWTGPFHIIATRWILFLNRFTDPERMPLWAVGLVVSLLALAAALWSVWMLNRSLLFSSGIAPTEAADHIYRRRALARGPVLVALGGGTGLSNLLSGLKEYTSNITAVVAVTDDGGSSGKLRRALGMIAPGDLTDCYAALSDSPVLARLLLHRFARGDGIQGHTFGNLLLATLSEEAGTLEKAALDVNEVLNVRGRVLPATFQSAQLVADLEDGDCIVGESQLALQRAGRAVSRMRLEPPEVPALPEVVQAIERADAILIGPGSLYTSLIPAILVPAVGAAIRRSPAPLIYVANIMSESGETDELDLEGHHEVLAQHLGRSADVVLVNSAPISPEILERYRAEGARLLESPLTRPTFRARVRHAPLVSPDAGQHDPALLARALIELLPRTRRRR
nr:uridine diphosphate-N-acetylglucosamine-binding protein YvcK [Deinobacterium chartae]